MTTAISMNSASTTSLNSQGTKERMYGVPVKFADDLFSSLITNQIQDFIKLPRIKNLKHTDENAVRELIYDIVEILKRAVSEHTKENYRVVIQVTTYPKETKENLIIVSQCLWNYRTDDVLSIEMETDMLKIFIAIHGLVA